MKYLFALCISFLSVSALRAEEARLYLELLQPTAQRTLGDTLAFGVYIDAGSLALTSASIYLSYDSAVFALVPAEVSADGRMLPFASDSFMAATVYENSLAVDERTQLNYIAVSGVGFAGARAVGRGRGLLASVRLRLVGYPAQGLATVWLDAAGQRQPSYTVLDEPGVERRFYVATESLYLPVEAEGLLALPDLSVRKGEVVEIDLAAHFLSSVWSAADLRWQASFRTDSGAVGVVDGAKLQLTATQSGVVDYWVETPAGVRRQGEFAVRVAPEERYLRDGAIYMVEDAGVFYRALDEYLTDRDRVGMWSVRAGAQVAAAIEADQLQVVAPAEWAGADEIELRFCAGAEDCETMAIPVWVAGQNDAPTALAPPALDLVIGQRSVWPLQSIFADVDHPLAELVVSVAGGPVAALYREGDLLVVEALGIGEENARLHVEDPQGLAAEALWLVRVSAPSAGPRILSLPPLQLALDEVLHIDLSRYVEDADTPLEQLEWALRAEGVEASWAEGESFIIILRGAELGAATVYLTVCDPEGNEVVAAWGVDIVDAGAVDIVDAGAVDIVDAGAVDRIDAEETAGDTMAVVTDTLRAGDRTDPLPVGPAPTGGAIWSIAPLGSVQLQSGQVLSVSLPDYLIGRSAEEVAWSVDAAVGVGVEWVGAMAILRAGDSFVGSALLLFSAVDRTGQRHSEVLKVEVVAARHVMELGDIPDLELTAGSTRRIELANYVDRSVTWSVSGGEGLDIRIVEDVAILRALANFSGRSVLFFRAVDADGNAAVDIARVEVRADTAAVAGSAEPALPAPETGAEDGLELGVWPDYIVELGAVVTTPVLDELVLFGAAAAVQWSLRGGAFIDAVIDGDRRVVLDARSARIGREVFLLNAGLGSEQREVVLGVEVRAPAFRLIEPEAVVLADTSGYELAQLLRGAAGVIEWQLHSEEAVVRLEAGRLWVEAAPGLYDVLVTGRSTAGVERQITLRIRVEAEESELTEPGLAELGAASFAPQFAMPVRIELEAGASGRWPLQVFDADSPWHELVFSLAATGGQVWIEGAELFLRAGVENFSVHLHVRDPQGNEAEQDIEVLVIERDHTPPQVEFAGALAAAGQVLWTLRADEELGEALLLVDGQPLSIQQREGALLTWLQVPTGQVQTVRVVAKDRSGNAVQKQFDTSAGMVGGGSALESADGKLRVLGGAFPTPALLYAEGETYRLDFAAGTPVEIALVNERSYPGLFYGDGVTWREISAALSVDGPLLRAVLSEPGWLRAAEGQQGVVAAAAALVYPNPFNATTAIRLYMPTAGFLRAVVYDALGRRLVVLAEEWRGAGAWTLRWHGRDEGGHEVASGVYFVEMEGPGWRERARMLLLR